MNTTCTATQTHDDGTTFAYYAPWPGYTPEEAYRTRLHSLQAAHADLTTDRATLTITIRRPAGGYTETLVFEADTVNTQTTVGRVNGARSQHGSTPKDLHRGALNRPLAAASTHHPEVPALPTLLHEADA